MQLAVCWVLGAALDSSKRLLTATLCFTRIVAPTTPLPEP
jgi:hypothetical protein